MIDTAITLDHAASINSLANICFRQSEGAGWWPTGTTFNPLLVPAKLALITSEISEALEAHRQDLMDSHLPHRSGMECELADALIRILDLAGAYSLDIGGAMREKMRYNETRADHQPAARDAKGGKKY